MDPRLTRIEEALIAAHNALALVSGLVADYAESQHPDIPINETDVSETEQCCASPSLVPLMGGTVLCNSCGTTSSPTSSTAPTEP